MRTFVAVNIPESEPLKVLYQKLKENLTGVNIKYTQLQTLHITLAFLGETSPKQSIALKKHFKSISQQPFSIELEGMGYFGKKSSPSVVWVGVRSSPEFLALFNSVNECLVKEQFEPDKREFSPHLTIGRIKYSDQSNNLLQVIKSSSDQKFGTVLIDKFIFYESILQPSGPIYKPLETYYFS